MTGYATPIFELKAGSEVLPWVLRCSFRCPLGSLCVRFVAQLVAYVTVLLPSWFRMCSFRCRGGFLCVRFVWFLVCLFRCPVGSLGVRVVA